LSAIVVILDYFLTFQQIIVNNPPLNLVKLYFVSLTYLLGHWSQAYHSPKGTVVNCAPVDLVPCGARWLSCQSLISEPFAIAGGNVCKSDNFEELMASVELVKLKAIISVIHKCLH
jgi:hypothetical protein